MINSENKAVAQTQVKAQAQAQAAAQAAGGAVGRVSLGKLVLAGGGGSAVAGLGLSSGPGSSVVAAASGIGAGAGIPSGANAASAPQVPQQLQQQGHQRQAEDVMESITELLERSKQLLSDASLRLNPTVGASASASADRGGGAVTATPGEVVPVMAASAPGSSSSSSSSVGVHHALVSSATAPARGGNPLRKTASTGTSTGGPQQPGERTMMPTVAPPLVAPGRESFRSAMTGPVGAGTSAATTTAFAPIQLGTMGFSSASGAGGAAAAAAAAALAGVSPLRARNRTTQHHAHLRPSGLRL